MSETPDVHQPTTRTGSQIKRLIPTQKRSRARFEHILEVAAEILMEVGGDDFTMSTLVQRAGVPHGSLYQYFPDKTAVIGTLAERIHLEGRACVRAALAEVHTQKAFHEALVRISREYLEAFRLQPLSHHVWMATQTNPVLLQMDEEDMEILAEMVAEVWRRLKPGEDSARINMASLLLMHMIAAAVRFAVGMDKDKGDQALEMFCKLLPKNLSVLL